MRREYRGPSPSGTPVANIEAWPRHKSRPRARRSRSRRSPSCARASASAGDLRLRPQGPADGAQRHRLPVAGAARPHAARSPRAPSGRPTASRPASSAATPIRVSRPGRALSRRAGRRARRDLRRSTAPSSTPPRSCPPPTATREELRGISRAPDPRGPRRAALRAVVERVLLVGAGRRASSAARPAPAPGHHAYLGGLLEHTVAVATLVGEICQLHPRLDSDLLMAAALLHDVGKVARVHLRRRVRADRGGPAARPPRRSAPRSSARRPAGSHRSAARRCFTACSPTTAPTPPVGAAAGASAVPRRWRSTASTRSTPGSRARWRRAPGSSRSSPSPGRLSPGIRRRGRRNCPRCCRRRSGSRRRR